MASGIILLAEDDAKLRKLYTEALSAAGYTVMAVADGDEAINLLQNVRPRVIILDIMMPRMDGIETCRRAREILISTEIPIIFLTSLDRAEMLHQCLQAGGDDYIIKADSLGVLIERVHYWARRSKRGSREPRRELALAEVEAVITHAGAVEPDDRVLSSDTDVTVREMSRLITAARKLAAPGFGTTVAQKLYLLGYVVGVVDNWAGTRSALALRFDDYLSAVLRETGILSPEEIWQMIATLGELAKDERFSVARDRGQQDASAFERRVPDHVPKALAEFDEKIAASAPTVEAARLGQQSG